MGKRGGKKKSSKHSSGQHTQMSFREEFSMKKQTNSLQSIMKLQHLQNLAIWAAREASIPPLGALFGHRFAATGEALGLPPDPSLFPCQRCETILQPGFNCTIRVVRSWAKTHQQCKNTISAQLNNVVYNCHFCTNDNVKKGHVKEICPPKPKPMGKKQATFSLALLNSKKRKRNKAKPEKLDGSEAKLAVVDAKKAEIASSKRRRKGWTTLKEIAESSERERSRTFTNLSIPFTP